MGVARNSSKQLNGHNSQDLDRTSSLKRASVSLEAAAAGVSPDLLLLGVCANLLQGLSSCARHSA